MCVLRVFWGWRPAQQLLHAPEHWCKRGGGPRSTPHPPFLSPPLPTVSDMDGVASACSKSDVCIFFLGTSMVANQIQQ